MEQIELRGAVLVYHHLDQDLEMKDRARCRHGKCARTCEVVNLACVGEENVVRVEDEPGRRVDDPVRRGREIVQVVCPARIDGDVQAAVCLCECVDDAAED